jgi:hypothetical protein
LRPRRSVLRLFSLGFFVEMASDIDAPWFSFEPKGAEKAGVTNITSPGQQNWTDSSLQHISPSRPLDFF